MENPFEVIIEKLNNIENLLKSYRLQDNSKVLQVGSPEILNLDQATEYLSLSKSTLYKFTSQREIPHFKKGKKIYFRKKELDDWLTQLRIATKDEIEQEAINYLIKNKRRRR